MYDSKDYPWNQIEAEIVALGTERVQAPAQTPNDFNKAFSYFKYYLEHLDLLLLNYPNPIQQARYFGVIFNNAPTFGDIESGTENVDNITGVNSLFRTKTTDQKLHGWGGGIRTPECWDQNPVPYHLATPHRVETNE